MGIMEKYPELTNGRKNEVRTFPDKFENLKQDLKRNFQSSPLMFNNNNNDYQFFTHEKEGADNKGFDDSEVVNQSANNSILSTFKPQGNKSPQKRKSQGLKIMFIDHQKEAVQSEGCNDSFEEVDLKENTNNI